MKSVKERLTGQEKEVLKVAETYGRFQAMTKYGIKDYIAFSRWIEEETGDKNFGDNPKIRYTAGQSLGMQLMDAFLSKISHYEAQVKELREENEYLRLQLIKENEHDELRAIALLSTCEE